MGFLGGLEKMKILAYKIGNFKSPVGDFTVLINPEKYTENYEICYNDVSAQGSSGGTPRYNKTPSRKVDLELVFDGTGVVPSKIPGVLPFMGDGVAEQLTKFKALVYDFDGKIHSPKFLELVWGKFVFTCRLTSLSITYTLFKPDGTPLRARANANFKSYNDELELSLSANTNSPDLSHVLTVRAGDLLPLMCYDIYGSSAYYSEVARVNGLSDFRNLVVGTQLLFPPLGEAKV
jgi:Contractile injection system tube protein